MKRSRFLTVLLLIHLALCFCGCTKQSYLSSNEEIIIDSKESEDEEAGFTEEAEGLSFIYVQVQGAVNSPGVYQLSEGSRVFHAIDAAGGLAGNADDSALNQAEPLSDGQKLLILTKHQAKKLAKRSEEKLTADADDNGLININLADTAALMTLPGIGQTRAEAVIEYRQSHGSFSSVEDIKKVSGIGDSIYSKLADKICT